MQVDNPAIAGDNTTTCIPPGGTTTFNRSHAGHEMPASRALTNYIVRSCAPQIGALLVALIILDLVALSQPVFCELRPLSEGFWQLTLWQDDPEQEATPNDLILATRLLTESGSHRLAGSWQSLPASRYPGQGRLEIEPSAADSFRFALFAPALDQPP
ncbi:hypothetical protein DFAR_2870041 [Desulfarculales bacterium]